MFHIHERFLRHLWGKQYLLAVELRTTTNDRVTILSPGTPNPDAGPDFLDARIQIEGKTYLGDVELHKESSDWTRHRHSRDPRYNRVVLHVVLYETSGETKYTQSGRALPELCLQRYLDDSFRVIWDRTIADDRASRSTSLPCSSAREVLSPEEILQWIGRLAYERLELKLRRFDGRVKEIIDEHRLAIREPRLRYYGDIDQIPAPTQDYTTHDFASCRIWEQVLYEGIFEGLGYSKNREPFLKLARNATLDYLSERRSASAANAPDLLAPLLYGVAGFLDTPADGDWQPHEWEEHRIRWSEEAPCYTKERIQKAEWTNFRLRPNNFPDRRLAAGVVLVRRIMDEALFKKMVGTFTSGKVVCEIIGELRTMLSVRSDDQGTLLGKSRIDEIIINTVIPLVSLYARIFRVSEIHEAVKEIYARYPSNPENSRVRFVRKSVPGICPCHRGALVQQGLLHLYNFYCTEKRCTECKVGQAAFPKTIA